MSVKFLKPEEDELIKLGEELKTYLDKIIKTEDGIFWYIKTGHNEDHKKREKLAYILGRNWVNVAEVKDIDEEELNQLVSLGYPVQNHKFSDIYLTKLGQGYSFSELIQKDINEAVAGELIFSLWIRRRDAHVKNRIYLNGIPIFFDHHIAFLAEGEDLRSEDGFYAKEPQNWKVKVSGNVPTTIIAREELKDNAQYYHFINNLEKYKETIQKITEILKSDKRDYKSIAQEVGFNQEEAEKISVFLEESKNNLDVGKLISISTQPV